MSYPSTRIGVNSLGEKNFSGFDVAVVSCDMDWTQAILDKNIKVIRERNMLGAGREKATSEQLMSGHNGELLVKFLPRQLF